MRYLGLLMAAGIPLGVYIVLLGDCPYWLDSPEFVGAAFAMQPAHPPGHPLYVLLGRAILLLPLGSAALRMNLLGALCASFALALTHDTAVRLVRDGFGVTSPLVVLVPTLGCILVGISPGWLHQAIYAEVYSLQALLLALFAWCLVRGMLAAESSRGARGVRSRFICLASLVLGLSLANHHLTGVLMVPAAIAGLTFSALSTRLVAPIRLMGICVVMVLAGLCVYALIPIRGVVEPSMILGRVETIGDFMWLVSAKVYQKSIGSGWTQAGDLGGAAFLVAEQVGIGMAVLSFGGFYFAVRIRKARACGVFVLVAAATSVGGRMMLQFDRTNPDVMGYLLVVLVLLVTAITALAAALHGLAGQRRWLRGSAVLAIALFVCFSISVHVPTTVSLCKRGDGVRRSQTALRELGAAGIPPGSVAVTTLYATSFLTWYGRVVEGERPDVRHVPLAFVGYRGEAAVLVQTWPDLAPIVRSYLVSGALPASEMASLSQDRHVYVEPDPFLEKGHIQYLEPAGIFMAYSPEPVAMRDVMSAADESAADIDDLLARHGVALAEPQTRRFVLWWLYNRALVLARRGYTAGALRAARQALAVAPGVPELVELVKRLESNPDPVDDPTPFIP